MSKLPARPALQTVTLWIAAISVSCYGVSSVVHYRPGGVSDGALALGSLQRALTSLDDEGLDPAARLAAYRSGLGETEALLRRSICSSPVATVSIERLATVQWETGVLAGVPDPIRVSSLINLAAAQAPRVPEIQANLGALLYKMGNGAEADRFMRRAVKLSPTITNRVVATMFDAGVGPDTIADTLPSTLELVLALKGPVGRSGAWSRWLANVEVLLPDHPEALLWSYTDACLATNAADRLLAHVEALGVLPENGAEARRQIAIGRAHLPRKELSNAGLAADRARALAPTDTSVLDNAGQIAFAAGNVGAAEASFRDALRTLALEGGREKDRARLYRQHGQALERLGRVEEAFDEYRRAIELLPDDPWLRQRYAVWPPKAQPDNH